jgi:hypothetical protein
MEMVTRSSFTLGMQPRAEKIVQTVQDGFWKLQLLTAYCYQVKERDSVEVMATFY